MPGFGILGVLLLYGRGLHFFARLGYITVAS